ncbi:hypothetical protein ACP4OV_021230 [Aristida adscensionis]
MIGSAVAQETVSQVISGLAHKYLGKEKSIPNENLERLEMAHIKLEAALEISNKWLITDASLLRWRKRLKLAAKECNETLHKCKATILEEQMEQEVRTTFFPKRIAHATKSFIFSAFSGNNDEFSRSTVRRFEWFADGACEFLRFVEVGGTPRCHMPTISFIKHIFAGKKLHHKIIRGNEYPSFLLSVVPFNTAEHGIEAGLLFVQKDDNVPENNFFLTVMLQISESTDIVGITIKCLQLYTPNFKSTVEIIRKELTELAAQDLSWVPYVDSWQKEHWDNLHSFSTQWFRPNPLCCKQLRDASLESVIEVNLQCQVSLSEYNEQMPSLPECKNSLQDSPRLKVGLVFTPHGSSEEMYADKSSTIAAVDDEKQHCLHANITLEQLEEVMLPKAIDFRQNTEARVYQMLWMAYIQVEKMAMRTHKTYGGARKRKLLQREEELGSQKLDLREVRLPPSQTNVICHFINLWAAHTPVRLRGSIFNWIQKEKEIQLAAPDI